jgi:hypothetical protein
MRLNYERTGKILHGWRMPPGAIGRYGVNYLQRASVSDGGPLANTPDESGSDGCTAGGTAGVSRRAAAPVLSRAKILRAIILAGQRPVELTPTRLIALSRGLPHEWRRHRNSGG